MKKKKSHSFTVSAIIFLMFCVYGAQAGVQKNLNNFFEKFGASTNVTGAGVYQSQSAGYYTGGNFFARTPVKNVQLASMRLPSYRAGCGGIDMHLGAFSHIKGKELVSALKSIGSAMGSYAMLLALETVSPQIKNIMTELNNLAQMMNQTNINSCEVAATALGGVLPRTDATNKHLCTMMGTDGSYGAASDYARARQECGAGGQRNKMLSHGNNIDAYKNTLKQNFNLAWKAIHEHEFLKKDPELAALFMAISGTIVVLSDDNDRQVKTYPSLAHHSQLLEALLFGGTTEVYGCNDTKDENCLSVSTKKINISHKDSLNAKVRGFLESIQNKIYADEPLTEKEKAFLNSTRLPFYKMLNVGTAFQRGEAPMEISDYSELAAIDLLFNYVEMILETVSVSLYNLQKAQIDDTQLKEFQKGLSLARARIQEKRMGTFKQVEQVMAIIQKTELIEKMISSKLSSIADQGY